MPLVSPKRELHSYLELEERGTQPDTLCQSPSTTMREVLALPKFGVAPTSLLGNTIGHVQCSPRMTQETSLTIFPRSVQTRPTPAGPTKQPDPHPILAYAPKTRRRWVEWWVFFPKTRATRLDECYIQIRPTPGRSSSNPRRSSGISTIFMRFSQIRPNPSRFSVIFVYILAISMQIQ